MSSIGAIMASSGGGRLLSKGNSNGGTKSNLDDSSRLRGWVGGIHQQTEGEILQLYMEYPHGLYG